MVLQKQEEDVSGELTEPLAQDSKTKIVEEEEEALVEVELEDLGSESSFETETPNGLGDGGHPTPEDEDSGPLFFDKSLQQLDTSHTVTCTFSISLAVPMAAGPKHRPSNLTDKQRKTSNAGKDAVAIPKMRRYYHIEYFLLPGDVEPRKLDLVLFGVVAKLFVECESKVVKPWFENDQIWVSWNHSIDIHVTNEFLIKLRDHKVTLTIWDTKDKVSAKARFSKSRVPDSPVEDSDAIVNVYAPNSGPEQVHFCRQASAFLGTLDPHECMVLGGDFNTTLEDRDRSGVKTSQAAAGVLREIVDHHSLVDVWRDHHPDNDVTFTYVRVEVFRVSIWHEPMPPVSGWPRSRITTW
ncbi:unnamed protein product [Caretta caretta]